MPVELSRHSETSAKPVGLRFSVPAKITSSILLPRKDFMLCSPITQRIASEILLFPLPLGPTIAVMPLPKSRDILSTNDLNPCISSFFKYISTPPFYFNTNRGHIQLHFSKKIIFFKKLLTYITIFCYN